MQQTLLIADVETTGIGKHPTHGHPQVIEMSHAFIPSLEALRALPEEVFTQSICTSRYKPSMPIEEGARAIHGITLQELLKEPPSESLIPPKCDFMLGHNISYDHRCLGKPDTNLICTIKLLKKLKKLDKLSTDDNKLTTVIKKLHPEREDLFEEVHTSRNDVIKTFLLTKFILQEFSAINSFVDLYKLQNV